MVSFLEGLDKTFIKSFNEKIISSSPSMGYYQKDYFNELSDYKIHCDSFLFELYHTDEFLRKEKKSYSF